MFLSRDKPIEIRRKATMERLKRHAQDDGKQVLVENDRLLIDGTGAAVFSLSRGCLNDHLDGRQYTVLYMFI